MKGYKTIAFNILMSVIAIVSLWNPDAELPDAATVQSGLDATETAIVSVWGIGNLILRAVTNSPIFKSSPDA